jgi:hypothetical protein
VPGQPGLHAKSLSQKEGKKKKKNPILLPSSLYLSKVPSLSHDDNPADNLLCNPFGLSNPILNSKLFASSKYI